MNGHGGTPFVPHSTVLNYAEDVFDVLTGLGIRGAVHVVAHSYGGPVALAMAHVQPDRFRSMSFINSFAKHPLGLKWLAHMGSLLYRVGEGRFAKGDLTDKAQVVETVHDIQDRSPGRPRYYDVKLPSEERKNTGKGKEVPVGVARSVIDYVLRHHTYESTLLQQEDARNFPPASPDGLIDFFNAARNFQMQDVLAHPALVIHSRRDRIIPYLTSRMQLAWSFNPHAKAVRLPTFSHVPHREFPEKVNGLILEHVLAVSSRIK